MVIFLDKAARPFAHIFRILYPAIHPGKVTPTVRFINFGREKAWMYDWMHETTGFNDTQDLEGLFDKENVDILRNQIAPINRQQTRVVVDDVKWSGETYEVLERALSILDPNSSNRPFFILDTQEDQKAFIDPKEGMPYMPWLDKDFVKDYPIKDMDEEDTHFLSTRVLSVERSSYGRNLRKELNMLAEEIKSSLATSSV